MLRHAPPLGTNILVGNSRPYIKGLLLTIVPCGFMRPLFLGGGGIEGVPLNSHNNNKLQIFRSPFIDQENPTYTPKNSTKFGYVSRIWGPKLTLPKTM